MEEQVFSTNVNTGCDYVNIYWGEVILIKKVLCTSGTHKLDKIAYNQLVIIALGSNIGNRILNIKSAVNRAPLISKICASLYETPALLPKKHCASWNKKKYLNTVVCGYSNLTPLQLFFHVKKIESFLCRKTRVRWAPRSVDIDIIFYKGLKVNNITLTIPHKEAKNRNFVLLPVQELLGRYSCLVENSL